MTTLLSRIFRDRCVNCQVGQGAMCQCQGGARVRNGRKVRIPEPVQVLLIYGASVAVVVGLGVWLWS